MCVVCQLHKADAILDLWGMTLHTILRLELDRTLRNKLINEHTNYASIGEQTSGETYNACPGGELVVSVLAIGKAQRDWPWRYTSQGLLKIAPAHPQMAQAREPTPVPSALLSLAYLQHSFWLLRALFCIDSPFLFAY